MRGVYCCGESQRRFLVFLFSVELSIGSSFTCFDSYFVVLLSIYNTPCNCMGEMFSLNTLTYTTIRSSLPSNLWCALAVLTSTVLFDCLSRSQHVSTLGTSHLEATFFRLEISSDYVNVMDVILVALFHLQPHPTFLEQSNYSMFCKYCVFNW